MTRIVGIDPGMQKDSFAIVIIETDDEKIKVKATYSWRGKSYLEVEKKIAELHNSNPCDYYVVEQNNTGTHVIQNLRQLHNIPNIIPVFTSKDIKEPGKHPHTMDKNEMVRWMLTKKEKKELEFPPITASKHMQELRRQMSNFGEQKTRTGSMKYTAPNGEHDDYVMALMLACWWAEKSMVEPVMIIADRLSSSNDKISRLNEEYDQGLTGLRWEQK